MEKKKKRKPTQAERARAMPYIEISDGTLICAIEGQNSLHYTAGEDGAEQLGEELAARGYSQWIYSSSIDFPEEYGGSHIDFRTAIERAAGLKIRKDRPW